MPKIKDLNQQPNLPQLEEETLKWWQDTKAFEKSVEMRPADKSYEFYDGPPFATGMPHYGHLLASTTKDVIPRYWTMKGYRVERVWGWDCHGLPIENMIEQNLEIKGGKKGIEKLGIGEFNDACQREVLRLDKEWEKIINRLGRWVDFSNNYKTMDCNFMESVWWGFDQLHKKGLVYEGKRVILYCSRCGTPLSNFEIAMDNSYKEVTEPSTTYKYKIKDQENTYLLAWSTTPWNKLATPALAVHPTLEYSKIKQGNEFYILATSRLENTLTDEPYEIVETFAGEELTKFEFELHFDFYPNREDGEKAGVIVADEFVTDEEGTGVVTLAIYGEDDYRVMKRENIQLIEHIDEEGKMKAEVKPWAGMYILKANPLIDEDLKERNLIYKNEQMTHNVATCYRCSTRLYYAPVPAWFVNIAKIKDNLIAQNEKINWYPKHLKHGRFKKGLENAPDWNISRSRYWGTPMPIWRGKKGEETLTRIIGSIEELQKWAVDPKEVENISDIHRQYIDHVELWVDDDKTVKGKRLPEVFDCWVESGSMPFASLHYPFENKDKFEKNYPAEFVSEYIAQTRAWFYTMHVMSIGIFEKPSFENVLTTGTILSEDGSKMSKSKKNYPDPSILIDKYGVDSLRLYLMSSTVMKGENLSFSEKEVSDIRRKVFVIWWNVFKFFKTFADQSVDVSQAPTDLEHVMDKWLLSKTQHLIESVTQHMDNYELIKASRTLMTFVDELSTWYLRLSRDRVRAKDNKKTSHAFGYALYTLAQSMAPLAPYFPELIHHNLIDESTSIHHTDWPVVDESMIDLSLEKEMELAQEIVAMGRNQRVVGGVKLRQPLSKLTIYSKSKKPSEDSLRVIATELNLKRVVWEMKSPPESVLKNTGDELEVEGLRWEDYVGDFLSELDFNLTPELKAEGEARELMRDIQKMRKKAGLQIDQQIEIEVPQFSTAWQKEIEAKTNAKIIKGEQLRIISS